nr:sigma factor-like helix-turn-helix DNA-binding protein [Rhodococcus qingshengii]
MRKHFRDRGWDVRVPRSLQENYLALIKARSSLTQALGREPTVPELAKELGVEPAEIAEIVAAGDSYHAASLDAATVNDGRSIAESLGDFGSALDSIDNHETLRPALLALPERERTIVLYRFFGDLTQAEIAEKVGLSQMHVSRLLTIARSTPPNTVPHGARDHRRSMSWMPRNADSRATRVLNSSRSEALSSVSTSHTDRMTCVYSLTSTVGGITNLPATPWSV